jgi:hypothetical protein
VPAFGLRRLARVVATLGAAAATQVECGDERRDPPDSMRRCHGVAYPPPDSMFDFR